MAKVDQREVADELVKQLPIDHQILFTAIRNEFDAKIHTVQARGIAALLGGGALGGICSALLQPNESKAVAIGVARFFGL